MIGFDGMAGKPRDGHGTQGWYINHKCRCDLCKVAHRNEARAYRARKKEEARAAVQATLAPMQIENEILDQKDFDCV